MNGMNGKQPDYPEIALVPYPVIVAASKGDPDAMKIVLQHFSVYIASLSMRKLYDERGNVYYGVGRRIIGATNNELFFPFLEKRPRVPVTNSTIRERKKRTARAFFRENRGSPQALPVLPF